MTWATGTSEAPRLRTYAEAKAHEAKVVPIKNKKRTEPCKPLGRRDCTGLTISKEGGKIIVRLYDHDRVIYHPGGKIDVIIPYGSVGTADTNLFWSLLGIQVRRFDKRSWLYGSDGETTGWFPMKRGEKEHRSEYTALNGEIRFHTYKTVRYSASLTLTPPLPGASSWPLHPFTILGVEHPERTVVNREGTRQVRARYEEFGKLLRGVVKLERMALEEGSGVYAGNTGAHQLRRKARTVSDSGLFACIKSKDTGQQMQAARILAQRHVDTHHRYDWKAGASITTKKIDGKKVTDEFYRIIYKAHKKEAYTTEVVADGRLAKNRHHV